MERNLLQDLKITLDWVERRMKSLETIHYRAPGQMSPDLNNNEAYTRLVKVHKKIMARMDDEVATFIEKNNLDDPT